MENIENWCGNASKHVHSFQQDVPLVLFVGGFATGKRTLLDALIRRDLLRNYYVDTVCIKIGFCAEEQAVVHKKRIGEAPEAYPIDMFLEKFRGAMDDPDKVMDIDYVEIRQKQESPFGVPAELVVFPGNYIYSGAWAWTALEFMKKASAVVFLISSMRPFLDSERQHIKNYFANREMRNIFFVFTASDSLAPDDQKYLKERAREQLQDVFTANGKFDEELFNNRIFYTDAYSSLNTRMGRPTPTVFGDIMVDDDATGVPEFEAAMGKFLTDREKERETMDMYQQQQKLMDDVCNDIQACIDLVGKVDPDKEMAYGFIPGMSGMENQSKAMSEYIQTLRQGIFQVLFTGGFSAGKSTLLNALMRKDLLKTSINAETAVITKIVFHAEEKVIVYKKQLDTYGHRMTETYTVKSFFEKYRLDEDDSEKFSDVDYVQLQQDQDGLGGNLVQLVDSPGTSHSKTDTEMARKFAERASAIVFLINATMPFTDEDKQYIKDHFANQEMRNLFFVINRFDSVMPQQQPELKENVRKQLQDVFTIDGRFDEELFTRRVFYTNAFGSMNTRMGMATPTNFGNIMIDDNTTGVPQLETALGQFLTDSNRDKDALAAYVPRLATIFAITKGKIAEELRKYAEGLDAIQSERDELEFKIKDIEKILVGIEAACKTTATDLITDIKRDYENYVNTVATGWDAHFTDPAVLQEIKFKTTDLIAVATSRNEEKKLERLKPIQEAVAAYVTSKQPILNDSINQSITMELSRLSDKLAMYQEQLDSLDCPINVDEILMSVLKTAAPDAVVDPNMKINAFQVILGLAGADPEIALGGIAGGKSNMQAVVNAIALNAFEFIAIYVVAWPIGIAMLAARAWQMIRGWRNAGNDAAAKLISGLKANLIDDLNAGKAKLAVDMEKKISGGIIRAGSSLAQGFRAELDGERQSMTDMIENLNSADFNLKDETKRTASLLGEMAKRISHINELTVGKPLSEQEILNKAEITPVG